MNKNILKKAKIFCIICVVLLSFVSFLLANISFVNAQQKPAEIYSLSYEPSEPVVLESIKFSVGVKNNGQQTRDYKLEFVITKGGIVKVSDEFIFNLRPNAGTFFSPDYVPDDINEFDVIVKLYDRTSNQLIDAKTLQFNVVSDIGPFDLEVSIPSKFVKAGSIAPVLLTLANMGRKGTDVDIQISLECINQSDILKSFFIFMPANSAQNKITSIQTCAEEGQHHISASIRLFNRTWISSVAQFFLNKTYTEFVFDFPEVVEMKPGESKVFDVKIRNTGTTSIRNLKLLVGTIPQEWVKITPESITEVQPGESSIFIINITVPLDTEIQNYTFGISAAADEYLTRKESTFKVTGLSGLPSSPLYPIQPSALAELQRIHLLQILLGNVTDILLVVLILALLFASLRIARLKERRYSREEVLRKIRKTIG